MTGRTDFNGALNAIQSGQAIEIDPGLCLNYLVLAMIHAELGHKQKSSRCG